MVAGEVRTLAQRSAEAAKEIKGLIEASVSSVDVGAVQVNHAGASMDEIVSSVRRVTDLIGEITASASEQSEGFAQVNSAVSNLDQMTQQNAALVEESSAAANAMSDQAQRLLEVISVFNVGAAAVKKSAAEPQFTTQPAREVKAKVTMPSLAAAKPVKRIEPKASPVVPTKAATDDDWETF